MIVKMNGTAIPEATSTIYQPFRPITDAIGSVGDKLDTIIYWINPANWFTEGYHLLIDVLNNPATATFIVAGTIVAIMLTMLGAESPKRIAFWTWVTYFGLRWLLPA